MKLSDFDFYLPEELIAQHPVEHRDESRLLVLHKNTGEIEHKHFYDIIDYLRPGDVLVRNNSKVILDLSEKVALHFNKGNNDSPDIIDVEFHDSTDANN